MSSSTHERLVAGAVLLGSFGLFAVPTFAVTMRAVAILVSVVGAETLPDGVRVATMPVAALVSLEVVTEIAAVRLHGFAALNRSRPTRNLVRHVGLSVAVLAATIVSVEFLLSIFASAVPRDETLLLGLGTLVVLAVAWAFTRMVSAFYHGYRGSGGA
jgi:hypothetical protein